ncbi:ectoine hydroxylase-related dioxygenase (phytanoyl-CoA dioxygenase family) [Microbacterium sp. SLBN-154]|uniref:phytanoyl-CoA dioxygenase family protein n=1 Tax=Microbacterium sp. SLBN-154 TaxID=2768458 RepID=UPI00114E2846|nr:phytanoyl-CoA dioxygenase family protein [Microbacterium sp. SLBN-154]TQK17659.1 ectoine hydroxylase-related dioxygenase (phytanoyl-CoA dioxygenase family) [Microbacterium sp. SLBN-154]
MTPTTATRPGVVLHDAVDAAFIEQYRRDGYAVLRNALTPTEVSAINDEALRICRGDFGAVGLSSTNSAPLEFPTGGTESDADLLRRYLCIHYPHKLSDTISDTMKQDSLVRGLTQIIGPNVKSMQSMLFIKSEGKPGQAWHQDEHFIPTRDRSLTAVWIALDDATVENGCLWVMPGSHSRGVIYPDHDQDDPRFDCTSESYGFPYDEEDAVPVEIPAGAALFFNGYLLHRSLENSGKHGYRRALVYHYMSAESLLPWKEAEGDYFGEYDFRDITIVAGEDPYEYKGLRDLSQAYSRPDKDGGCDR